MYLYVECHTYVSTTIYSHNNKKQYSYRIDKKIENMIDTELNRRKYLSIKKKLFFNQLYWIDTPIELKLSRLYFGSCIVFPEHFNQLIMVFEEYFVKNAVKRFYQMKFDHMENDEMGEKKLFWLCKIFPGSFSSISPVV